MICSLILHEVCLKAIFLYFHSLSNSGRGGEFIVMEHVSENKLIESIYDITTNPNNFDEFLQLWEREFLQPNKAVNAADNHELIQNSQKVGNSVESHFFRAFSILEMVNNEINYTPTLKQIVEADPQPTFILTANKKIAHINEAACGFLNCSKDLYFDDIPFSVDDQASVEKYVQEIDYIATEKVIAFMQLSSEVKLKPVLFALSKFNDADSGEVYLRFSAVHSVWDDEIGKIIRTTFDLSEAEMDIAKKLVAGSRLSDIAVEKKRSINTVRTQSKSLFRKTNLKTQSELIRLFAMLQNYDYQEKDFALEHINPTLAIGALRKQNHNLVRPDGRNFYYEIYGDPHGEPVLFIHGGISGTKLPQNVINYLKKNKIKFISPHRAGFGYSDINPNKDKILHFGEDIEALLDHENIDTCKLIGHHVGSYYAYYLGSKFGHRFSRIRIVGGAVPVTSLQQINEMTPRQRIITYTAKYTPKLLPFLLRASIAQIKKHGVESNVKAIYEDCEPDFALFNSAEAREAMVSGLRASHAHGVGSVVTDAFYIFNGNWSELVENCTMPIDYFHGSEDSTVPIHRVEEFLSRHGNMALNIIDGAQFILYKSPQKILEKF